MILTTITHTGRRVSYQALVRVTLQQITSHGTPILEAEVRDETGLWSATVLVDNRLMHRMGDDAVAYFWARIRGGTIDLRDREIDPEWAGEE